MNTRPNTTKFQASQIKRAAKAAYFRYLASKPRPLHPGASAEDEAANAEYAEETARLEQTALVLGVVLERDELMTHEREIFDTEFKALEDCYLGTCSGRWKSTVTP